MSYHHFDIDELSDEERLSLVDDIYGIYQRLFHGWNKSKLIELINDPSCEMFKARIFLDPDGKPIGFAWISGRPVRYQGKSYTIFHNMGGLDASARKSGLITSFMTSVIVRYRFRHPFHTIFCIQRLIHPASYCAWTHAMHDMYPRRNIQAPASVMNLTAHLLDVFQYKAVDANNPFVVTTDNHVNLTQDEKRLWLEKHDEDVAFYNHLTGNRDEYSVVAIFPLSFRNMVLSLCKGVYRRWARKFQA